jgi:hypothetical protein
MNGNKVKPKGFPRHGTNNHLVPNIRGFIWTPYYNSRKFAGVSPLGVQTTRACLGDRTFSVAVGLARLPSDGTPYIRILTVNESVDGIVNPHGIALEGDCFHPHTSHSKGLILKYASKDDVRMFEEHVHIINTILDGLEIYGARNGATVSYEKMVLATQEGLFEDLLSAALKGEANSAVKRWDQNSIELVTDLDFEIGLGINYDEVEPKPQETHSRAVQALPIEPVSVAELNVGHLIHMMNHMGFIHYHLGKGPVQVALEGALASLKAQLVQSISGEVLFVYDPGEGHRKLSTLGGIGYDLFFRPAHQLGERVLRGKNKGKDLYRYGSLFWGSEKTPHSRWGEPYGELFSMYYYRNERVVDRFAFADLDDDPGVI